MLNFNLNEEQAMIRDMARKFAEKEMLPAAEHYDQSDEFPWPIIKKAQKIGLISSNIPEEYGGPGLDVLGECIINEALAGHAPASRPRSCSTISPPGRSYWPEARPRSSVTFRG